MSDLLKTIFDLPVPKLFIIVGIAFLAIGLIGKIGGKINPGKNSRIACSVFGCVFIVVGLVWYQNSPHRPNITHTTTQGSSDDQSRGPKTNGPPPSQLRVVQVQLLAEPASYTGRAPVTARFVGQIAVAGGGGRVSYRFVRSDGSLGPAQTLTFEGAGSKEVSTTWQLERSFSGWETIEILGPQKMDSDKAIFSVRIQ